MKIKQVLCTIILTFTLLAVSSVAVFAQEASDDPQGVNSGAQLEEKISMNLLSNPQTLTYASPYVTDTNGRSVVYTVPDQVASLGIDVSSHNGTIDWQKVAADGVEFAFIRGAYRGYGEAGTLVADTNAKKNIEGARAAGIKVGVYIYSQAVTVTEAREEANFLMNQLQGQTLDLPIVFDFEYADDGAGNNIGRLYNAKLSKATATEICLAFCQTINEWGANPLVYANVYMLNQQLDAAALSAYAGIWLAHYTTVSSYQGDCDYWQYSDKGTVNGISSKTDCNFAFVNKTYANNGNYFSFRDVTYGSWYYTASAYAFKNGLFSGTGKTEFSPDWNMSRSMLVSVLYRLEGKPGVIGGTSFTDLSELWYRDAVIWAQQNHIVSGISDTQFAPSMDLSREQIAAILYRYAQYKGYDVSAASSLSGFKDASAVSGFALDSMKWAVGHGYISGFDDKTLRPQGSASRAQVASILMRFCEDNYGVR